MQTLPYFNTEIPVKWNLSPQFKGELILLIDPYLGMVKEFELKGWKVDVFVTSKTIAVDQGITARFQHSELTHNRYAAILIPSALSFVKNVQSFLDEQISALKEGGTLWAYLPNALYYGRLIAKGTRELRPWPRDLPLGRDFVWDSLQTVFNSADLEANYDSQSSDPHLKDWKFVDGGDVQVQLPTDLNEKRQRFCHGWTYKFTKNSTSPYEDQIKHIESKLAEGQTELVENTIDSLFRQNPKDARLANFRGILRFYQGQIVDAYCEFMSSLELDPRAADVWQNAKDVALQLGRFDDLKSLYNKKSVQYGLLNLLD